MKKTKIFAVVFSLLLCVSLASCTTVVVKIPVDTANAVLGGVLGGIGTGSSEDTTALQPDTPTVLNTENTTAAPAGEVTTAAPAAEATTAAPAGEATTAAPAAEATTAAPAPGGAPSTKEEIISYYVTAYNKIATDAKTITKTYDYTNQYNNILDIDGNATLEKIAGTLMNQFMVENTDAVTMDAASIPPVGVTTLNLTPDKVSEATCKDNGDTYVITLKSTGSDANWEVDSQAGVGSAGCIGPLLRSEDVSGAAGSLIKFEGLHTWYGTASVEATVEKSTGHIVDFKFLTPSVLHFDQVTAAVVVKVKNCNIGLLFQQNYTIAY